MSLRSILNRIKQILRKLRPTIKFRRTRNSDKPAKLPSTWSLLKDAVKLLRQLRIQTLALIAIHSVIIYIFETPTASQQFGVVTFVGVVIAMAYIWLARQTTQPEPLLSTKQALYRGPVQIVPFMLLVLLMGLQALPFSIGGLIYQIGVNSSPPIAIFYWEKLLFAAGWVALSIPTLYWLLPSLLGLIVVSLPGVAPLQARRAAQQLVEGRMFRVWLKLLWLLLIYGLVFGGLAVGLVLWLPQTTIYLITYSGVLILPVLIYQVFSVYQTLRKQ